MHSGFLMFFFQKCNLLLILYLSKILHLEYLSNQKQYSRNTVEHIYCHVSVNFFKSLSILFK